jgi:3-oxoacyl-[acyl-carrier-protein] synthase-3
MKNSRIISTGAYLPGNPVSNEKLSELFGIDEWIFENVGVNQRYWSVDLDTKTLTKKGYEMAGLAAKKAIDNSTINTHDIDTIFLVTASPDYIMPNSAVLLQEILGIEECNTFEIHSACSGAIQAIELADSLIRSEKSKNVLICCFNLMSPYTIRELSVSRADRVSIEDLLNIAMFGDGASAILMTESKKAGIEYVKNNSIGTGKTPGMQLLAGGSVYPFYEGIDENGLDKWKHDANAILEYGSDLSKRALEELLSNCNSSLSDYDHFIFPQANPSTLKRDIKYLNEKYEVPAEKIFFNVDVCGNTSTPGLFIALDELNNEGLLKKNERIMLIGGEASKWLYGAVSIIW